MIAFYVIFLFLIFPASVLHASLFSDPEPEIQISGLEADLESNVRAYLTIQNFACDADDRQLQEANSKIPEKTATALRALGYYHVQAESRIARQEGCWALYLNVQPGKATRYRRVDIRITGMGAEEADFVKIISTAEQLPGTIVHHGEYEQLKKNLRAIASNYGYFDFQITDKKLIINTENNQAELLLHMHTGNRYYYGDIAIDQHILDPQFVLRYIDLKPGRAYRRKEVSETHFALDGSAYFDTVQITVDNTAAENYRAPVKITLLPAPRHKVSVGLGYDTDLGFRGGLDYETRYINRSGHRFKSDLSVSQKKSYAFLGYQIPLGDPRKQKVAINSGFVYEDTDTVLSETYTFGVRYSQKFEKKQVMNAQINFVAERFDSGGGEDKFKIMVVPGLSWSNVITDGSGFDLSGLKYSTKLQGAHDAVLSDTSFIQLRLRMKYIFNLPWHAKIISRTDLGITAVSTFDDLPSSYRFYAGGDNSIRGYAYKAIGAKNEAGEVIGGKFLTVASLEYEQQVYRQWSMAAFIDIGDAFNDQLDMKYGVGFGVRWYSLIGPIRVDMAFPNDNWSDFRFHFSFSTAL